MFKLSCRAMCFTIPLVLVACAKSDQSVENDYVHSPNAVAPLTVPPGATPPKESAYYQIPSNSGQGPVSPSIQPPDLSSKNQAALKTFAHQSKKSKHAKNQKHETLILPSENAWQKIDLAIKNNPYLTQISKDTKKRECLLSDSSPLSGHGNTPRLVMLQLQPVKAGYLVTVTDAQGELVDVVQYNKMIENLKGYIL